MTRLAAAKELSGSGPDLVFVRDVHVHLCINGDIAVAELKVPILESIETSFLRPVAELGHPFIFAGTEHRGTTGGGPSSSSLDFVNVVFTHQPVI
jgi:hypothetical protein